jgi:hypothetical protein
MIRLFFFFFFKTNLYLGALFHLGALGDCLIRLMVEPALLYCKLSMLGLL